AARDLLLHGRDADALVTPRAARYIKRYGLYRGTIPATRSRDSLAEWHCQILADAHNESARKWADKLAEHRNDGDADFIVTLGGDGSMLRAIREHWRRRL